MKLTIERAALLRALGHVQSVVERRNTIPILSNVMLDARDGNLSLTATDMEIAIVETVPAEISTVGAITAPAHTLYDIVRKLPDGAQIGIETDAEAGQLNLKAGRARFKLGTLDTAEFPAMTDGDLPTGFVVSAQDFRSLIDRTRFAISSEETRYYLNGIYLHAAEADGKPTCRVVDVGRQARHLVYRCILEHNPSADKYPYSLSATHLYANETTRTYHPVHPAAHARAASYQTLYPPQSVD